MSLTADTDLVDSFRDGRKIRAFARAIDNCYDGRPLAIMEVCGGHTHTIYRYGLAQHLPPGLKLIHGPGCPVCIMPKERIDAAIRMAQKPGVILVTLGDMMRVPGETMSLADARAGGARVEVVYSPLDTLKIALQNPHHRVVFFAIGFETTTPMTAVLVESVIAQKIKNVFFHINHVLVPPAVRALLEQQNNIDAFIAPSHVSVVTGAGIYQFMVSEYNRPVVVAGFEPVDVMQAILMLLQQDTPRLEIQYKRNVDMKGGLKAQQLVNTYFEIAPEFHWRGLGPIPASSLQLREEFSSHDAAIEFADECQLKPVPDHKLCLCGEILKGRALPKDCRVFGKGCTPEKPLGPCMVSSEGACAAEFKYGSLL